MSCRIYNKELVGKKIACGGTTIVFTYGDKQVIKFSMVAWLVGRRLRERLVSDYNTASRYMSSYIVPVEQVSCHSRAYVEIQKYVYGAALRMRDLQDQQVKEQFINLLELVEQMEQAGEGVFDLVGNGGIFQQQLSNVLIDPLGRLQIIDVTFLKSHGMGIWGYLFYPVLYVAKRRQRFLIKKFLEYIHSIENGYLQNNSPLI